MNILFKHYLKIHTILFILNNTYGVVPIDNFEDTIINRLDSVTLLRTGFKRNLSHSLTKNIDPVSNDFGCLIENNTLHFTSGQETHPLYITYLSDTPIDFFATPFLSFTQKYAVNSLVNAAKNETRLFFVRKDKILLANYKDQMCNDGQYLIDVKSNLASSGYNSYNIYGLGFILDPKALIDAKASLSDINIYTEIETNQITSTNLNVLLPSSPTFTTLILIEPLSPAPLPIPNPPAAPTTSSLNTPIVPLNQPTPQNPRPLPIPNPPAAPTTSSLNTPLTSPIASLSSSSINSKTKEIEEEIEEENPVPEPFSILTMTTGIATFLRNKRKNIN